MISRIIAIIGALVLLAACHKSRVSPRDPDYTNFKVLKLVLWKMPFQDKTNEDWDLFDGPDVFFNMERAGGTVLFSGLHLRHEDITSSELPLEWELIPAYEITNIEALQFVRVYDFDTFNSNDEIGQVGFTLSEHKAGYPKVINKTREGVTVTLIGEWY